MRTWSANHFFVLKELVKRDFRGRYAGSVLGFAWSFVQPLWQLVLFSFVFSVVLRVSPAGERTQSFGIFLFCGLLPWLAVQEGAMRSATVITDQANLVKKLSFPSEILVASVVLAALLHEAIAAAVFLLVLGLTQGLSLGGLPVLLIAIPLQLCLTLGLGLLFASMQVFLRDIAQILTMVFGAWFYLTPIVYPLAYVPARWRGWVESNPMTALVQLYRQSFLGQQVSLVPGTLTLAAAAAGALLLGAWTFTRLKGTFADQI